jgi:alpha-L-fucosidase 2
VTDLGIRYDGGGGVYPNLFDACPPFQIDGNFGVTAAIAEMLLQSRTGEMELLPALPGGWAEGSIKGLRARGGVEVDLAWRHGRLTSVVIRSDEDTTFRLRYQSKTAELKIKKGVRLVLNGELEISSSPGSGLF